MFDNVTFFERFMTIDDYTVPITKKTIQYRPVVKKLPKKEGEYIDQLSKKNIEFIENFSQKENIKPLESFESIFSNQSNLKNQNIIEPIKKEFPIQQPRYLKRKRSITPEQKIPTFQQSLNIVQSIKSFKQLYPTKPERTIPLVDFFETQQQEQQEEKQQEEKQQEEKQYYINLSNKLPEFDIIPSNETPEQTLNRKLAPFLKTIDITIPQDGNCQFHSIQRQLSLHGNQTTHEEVRKNCVRWLLENKDYVISESTIKDWIEVIDKERQHNMTYLEYCNMMAQQTTWGDNYTLIAQANFYNAEIVIFSSLPERIKEEVFKPQNDDPHLTLLLAHRFENHYYSIIDISETK